MGQPEVRDLLALAEREESDQVQGAIEADPLNFRWSVPLPFVK
jgi:hypothetical protein